MGAVKLHGRLVCEDEQQAAIIRHHLPRHVELTRAEAGCLYFEVEQTDDPLIWNVLEKFVDRNAFEFHQARVRTSEWGQATAGILREYEIIEDTKRLGENS